MHNYHDTHKILPPAGSTDPEVGIGLSWRVRMLRFASVENAALHDRFHLDEPWDSPHNRELIPLMPDLYKVPGKYKGDYKTTYLAVTQTVPEVQNREHRPATVFGQGTAKRRLSDIGDGRAETIMVVEANEEKAVIWTQPSDWDVDFTCPKRGVGGLRSGGFLALFADCSTRFIPNAVSDEDLNFLLLCNDGQGREKQILKSLSK